MYSSSTPFVTPRYKIEVPSHEIYATPCVFMAYFGKCFYIGKAKSITQTATQIAEIIERALRTGNNDETGWYYHVISYIKRARVLQGTIKILYGADREADNLELLKYEHNLLVKYRNDEDCLNNNFDVYFPKWIPEEDVSKFNKWKNENRKRNRSKSVAANSRKKH